MAMKAMLVDTTRCIGCRGCQVACKMWNDRKAEKTTFFGGPGYQNPADLSGETWRLITYNEVLSHGRKEWAFGTRQCMHCLDPACATVCPVGALEKLDTGPVVYHGHKCIGCRYCMLACPFDVPRFEYDSANPFIRKCTMCVGRVETGGIPACAKACPTEAITFGDREEMIAEGHRRIANNPSRYNHEIYGLAEAGGTCVLHLASVPFAALGYPTDVPRVAVNTNTGKAMHAIPYVMIGMAALLIGSYRLRTRNVPATAGPATGGGEGRRES